MVKLGVIRALTNAHICKKKNWIFKLYDFISYNYVTDIADDV